MTDDHADIDNDFRTELVGLIPQMRAFARYLCQDFVDGEDLAQDALVKAWHGRESFTPGTNMKAWTFMIMRNQFYSDKRRSWRALPLDQEIAERTLEACSNPMAGLELDEVRRALINLPLDQREALILVGAGGLSYEEVSAICGCPIGTIKSRVSRARARLSEILEAGDYGEDAAPQSGAMDHIIAHLVELSTRYRAA